MASQRQGFGICIPRSGSIRWPVPLERAVERISLDLDDGAQALLRRVAGWPADQPRQAAAETLLVLSVVLALAAPSGAAVTRVEVASREVVLNGKTFGKAGPYETLRGTIHYAFDPSNPYNARIVDLDEAPRNAQGLVEARGDFMVLRPTKAAQLRLGLLEVSNRGGQAALRYFNSAGRSSDPVAEQDFGDALLMRQGLTIIWIGWQFDVPRDPRRLRLHVPVAGRRGRPLEGLVRCDWTVDRTVTSLELGHRGHVPYPLADPRHADNVLTVRDGRLAARKVVPRTEWQFDADDPGRIQMASGFQAGKLYELVYRARDPRVVGLGLAAVRDVMSYAKHDPESLFPVERGLAFGVSQTGRFLRHFLYQGFNTDESGRKVYDGLFIHTAGAGRGSFNHRFAQPSRDAHRYSAFFYPTDLFPFSGARQRDAQTGTTDGLFEHLFDPAHRPRIFYTNTGYEYWGRAASLIHTSPDGRSDAPLSADERLYHLASAQHFAGRFPPRPEDRLAGTAAYRGTPNDLLVPLRALLVALVEWVRDDVAPPPSAYPTIAAGTLVAVERLAFPELPGVLAPKIVHEAYRADYGSRWSQGLVDHQPPRLGAPFPSLVPQVDALGNELAGVKTLEVRVPLATFTPWNLRAGLAGGNGELTDFLGTYVPLPRSETERQRTRDPRSSVERLYPTRADYLAAAARAAHELVAERLLLPEDTLRVLQRAASHWDWLHASGRVR